MRFDISMAVAAVSVVAAVAAVAGCTSPSSRGLPGNPASSPASSQRARAAGSDGTCQAANLRYSLGAKSYPLAGESGTTGQTTQAVDLTNKGSSPCTLDGFPGVDLVGAANGQHGYTWSLVRQSASYQTVTLYPGGTAHFNVVYLPSSGASVHSDDIAVVEMVIIPPNDSTHAEVTWNQSMVLQDAATNPGTYITPVASGS